MRMPLRKSWSLALLLAGLSSLGVDSCDSFGLGSPLFRFEAPLLAQLSLPGDVSVALRAFKLVDRSSIVVMLDGVPLPGGTLTGSELLTGVLSGVGEGRHVLDAQAQLRVGPLGGIPLRAITSFDVADLFRPDDCEILNDANCLLPYPSSRFLEPSASTPTGYQTHFPTVEVPGLIGPPLDPTPLNRFDGFAPTAQVMMNFPQGVDLEASGAPILLEARCCGQSQTTPYVNVRTQDGRSVERNSPTVLLDADTGERVLHWVELDANAVGDPAQQVMFLRPGKSLVPGHHYIVAVRHLVDPDGQPVEPEAAFRALRDGLPSTIPALEARRAHFEDVFHRLQQAGVKRRDLVLAFDFVTRSDEDLTHRMLALRQDSLDWLAAIAPGDVSGFTITSVTNFGNCSDPAQRIWRRVQGTFKGPYYMTADIDNPAVLSFMDVDATDTPVRHGTHPFNWDVAVPCSVYRGDAPGNPLLLGHGFLGRGSDMVSGFVAGGFFGDTDVPYIAGATDWRGLSLGFTGPDALYLLINVIGTPGTGHKFNNFESLPDRLMQGQVNTLVLSRMMKSGFFNRLVLFQRVPGDPSTGVFPGPGPEMFYFGVSLGGIQGAVQAEYNQDIVRFNLDVPGMNFSILEQRSTQFPVFLQLIKNVGLSNPMDLAVVLQIEHEMWAPADPAGAIRHVTGTVDPPLPDTPAKKILMTTAWLDKQVSNQAQEIMARSLGIPMLVGSLQAGIQEIPDVDAGADGLDSAWVMYDVGYFDVFDPAYDPYIPPLANLVPSTKCDPHGLPRLSIPASVDQLTAFLQPGGKIFNFCDGICDAETPDEQPAAACDPLN